MTLVEQTVVIGIMALAAGIIVPNVADIATHSRQQIAQIQAKIDADDRQISALQGAKDVQK